MRPAGVFATGEFADRTSVSVLVRLDLVTFWRLVRRCRIAPIEEQLLREIAGGLELDEAAAKLGLEPRRARRMFDRCLALLSAAAETVQVTFPEDAQVAEVFALEGARLGRQERIRHCPAGAEKCARNGICSARGTGDPVMEYFGLDRRVGR